MAKQLIDKYFLESKCPYTKRRPLNMKALAWTGGTITALFVVVILFLGGEQEKKGQDKGPDYSGSAAQTLPTTNQGVSIGGDSSKNSQGHFGSAFLGLERSLGGMGGAGSGRTRSAGQVILRGANGNDPSAQLSIGFGIPVKLVNAVVSTDSATPVIAEVTDDVFAHNVLSIPASTRVIGTASYDDASRRIQLHFNTFVYPEGDQHSLQGMGLMQDGSAGLTGDYHSGETKRQFGRFVGNFVSGLADGMKDRTAGGFAGIPMEPGSVKNGLLNGVTLSAQDQAKAYSEGLGQTKPYMTLTPGQTFVIYLEKEYVP